MKNLLLTATALFLMVGFSSCTKCNDDPCIDKSKINPNAICTMEYAPVCGCDGLTYGNKCQAENAGVVNYTAGECGTKH